MIRKIKLTNFRQHESLELYMEDGITVVRGENEAGKSTVFEGVTFALFGVRACRNNDLTTWGKPEGSHKAEVSIEVGGVLYFIERSARAAEITYEGGSVTGQTEVTRFCERILELKPNMGDKLMFIPQNKMTGILAEGGASTTTMIEKLADFDVIEKIIETLQDDYTIGKTDSMEATLNNFQEQADLARAELEGQETPEVVLGRIKDDLSSQQVSLLKKVDNQERQVESLQATLHKLEKDSISQQQISSKLAAAKAVASRLSTELAGSEDSIPEVTSEERIAEMEADYEVALNVSKLVATYNLKDRLDRPDFVRMTEGDFRKTHAHTIKTRDEFSALSANYDRQLATLKGRIMEQGNCNYCGMDFSDVPSVAAENARLKSEVAHFQVQRDEAYNNYLETGKMESRFSALARVSHPQIPELVGGVGWEVVNPNEFPLAYQWVGDIPNPDMASKVQTLRSAISSARLNNQMAESRKKTLSDLKVSLGVKLGEVAELEVEAAAVGEVDQEAMRAANRDYAEANSALTNMKHKLNDVGRQLLDFDVIYGHIPTDYQKLVDRVATLDAEVVRYTEEIKNTVINNNLLRALRVVKPKIANQVWQSLCSTISHYFSIMRDQKSVVGKEDEFTVDGHKVGSLSGSTLDILGIAIRIALTKTFMPTCRILLLDEPFAACDAVRQRQALGFVTTAGFDQVIIVTHEDTTQTVADHFVTI